MPTARATFSLARLSSDFTAAGVVCMRVASCSCEAPSNARATSAARCRAGRPASSLTTLRRCSRSARTPKGRCVRPRGPRVRPRARDAPSGGRGTGCAARRAARRRARWDAPDGAAGSHTPGSARPGPRPRDRAACPAGASGRPPPDVCGSGIELGERKRVALPHKRDERVLIESLDVASGDRVVHEALLPWSHRRKRRRDGPREVLSLFLPGPQVLAYVVLWVRPTTGRCASRLITPSSSWGRIAAYDVVSWHRYPVVGGPAGARHRPPHRLHLRSRGGGGVGGPAAGRLPRREPRHVALRPPGRHLVDAGRDERLGHRAYHARRALARRAGAPSPVAGGAELQHRLWRGTTPGASPRSETSWARPPARRAARPAGAWRSRSPGG